MRKIVPIILFTLLLFFSCTVTEDITLSKQKSESITDIFVEDYFIDVLTDFAEFLPENDESIMDNAITTFSGQLEAALSAANVTAVKLDNNNYTIYFDFTSLEDLAKELSSNPNQSIIKQGTNSFSFYCDINNYEELEAIVPFLADPNIEVFLAKYNIGYTQEDYLDMIVFSLGDEAPESLQNSDIKFVLKTPGSITKVTNAKKISQNSIEFSFKLIEFLLLDKPLSFSVEWK